MDKDKFLQLKALFDEYKACEEALEKLQDSKKAIERDGRRVLRLFSIEIGTFRTKIDDREGVDVDEIRPVILDLIERMTTYYEQRMAEIDRTIEQA